MNIFITIVAFGFFYILIGMILYKIFRIAFSKYLNMGNPLNLSNEDIKMYKSNKVYNIAVFLWPLLTAIIVFFIIKQTLNF